MYDACRDTVGMDASANRRVNAVGVPFPLLSIDRVRSTVADGSSTSFSALGILFLRVEVVLSL